MGNCPRTTHHLLEYRHREEQRAPSLYYERLEAQLDRYLVHIFQDHDFSLSRPATSHSPVASVQRGLAAHSSALLAPPDANGGISPLAIGSLD